MSKFHKLSFIVVLQTILLTGCGSEEDIRLLTNGTITEQDVIEVLGSKSSDATDSSSKPSSPSTTVDTNTNSTNEAETATQVDTVTSEDTVTEPVTVTDEDMVSDADTVTVPEPATQPEPEPVVVEPEPSTDTTPSVSSNDGQVDALSNIPTASSITTTKLFVSLPSQFKIPVTLHPSSKVSLNSTTNIVFGVPFPKGAITNLSQLLLVDASGKAIPASYKALLNWRNFNTNKVESIRSVQVATRYQFSSTEPVSFYLVVGSGQTSNATYSFSAKDTWSAISGQVDPDEYSETIYEPKVYVTLSSNWLGRSLLKNRFTDTSATTNTTYSWYETSFEGFSDSAVNDVGDHVTDANKIQYETEYEPWLYDRAATLWVSYFTTGNLSQIRHAHRASQFYAQHINADGGFDLKGNDLKYSYGQSMMIDYALTGDDSLLSKIEQVAGNAANWNEVFTMDSNFWTERHQHYSLMGAMFAWETTGDVTHRDRVKTIIDAIYNHQQNPPGNYAAIGCLPHSLHAHEGYGGDTAICSPWMTALLGESVYRYYLLSKDTRALTILSKFGDYLVNFATKTASSEPYAGHVLSCYLASDQKLECQSSDGEHACDVAGLSMRSAWAKKQLSQNNSSILGLGEDLLSTCELALNYWHRTSQATIDAGKTMWRLSPPRKYNWWFTNTSDMFWLREQAK